MKSLLKYNFNKGKGKGLIAQLFDRAGEQLQRLCKDKIVKLLRNNIARTAK